jgi:Zn-dependent M28 family amino/carboxypeptidase
MHLRTSYAALAALCLAACASEKAALPPPAAAVAAAPAQPAPLSPEAIASHIKVLASDAFEGRKPGTEGEKKSIAYISEQFADAGLKPGGPDGTWFQEVPLIGATATGDPGLTITGRDGAKTYSYGDQQVIWTERVQPTITLKDAPLVFVGYGVNAPEQKWNDYAKADIKGKIAVILVNDPDFYGAKHQLFGGKAMTYYGRWTYKYEEAARQGAAGALIVHETDPAGYPWGVVQSSNTGAKFNLVSKDNGMSRTPIEGWMTRDTAADIFKRAGLDYEKLKAAAQQAGFKAVPMKLKLSVTLNTTFEHTTSHNVIGVLPGAAAPGEAVIYTAHWDHLGHCTPIKGDDICNGALDNASGVAGLIELARKFASAPPPKRSIVFLSVTAEEQGLLGSQYYAENPTFPQAKILADINMDGLPLGGPSRDVSMVGRGKSDLEDVVAAEAAKQGRAIAEESRPEQGHYFRSDHFSFAKVGIPAVHAGAGDDKVNGGVARGRALAEDYTANRYHKPQDEYSPDWDLTGATQDLELLYAVGRDVADGDKWPAWKQGAEFKAAREASLAAAGR